MTSQLVTVFGGSGFVGRHTVRVLARAGYRVRVAVRRPNTAHFLRPLGDVGQVELFQANIRDDNSVMAALDGAHIAINLVGILYAGGKQSFQAIQADGPGRIARLAKVAGVDQIIHLSSIGASLASKSSYARTKAQGEANLLEAFPEAVVLRPSIIFGPEDDFFNRFAALARFLPFLPLIGGGHTRFQPIYVDDVAEAILAAIQGSHAKGNIFELGGPCVYTFKELLQYILDVTRRRRLLIPIPFGLAKFQAFFLGLLPSPLLTMDQVELLKTDNIVGLEQDTDLKTIDDLGVEVETIETMVPPYLYRFRPHGQYEMTNA